MLLAGFPQRAKRLEAIARLGTSGPNTALRNGGGPLRAGPVVPPRKGLDPGQQAHAGVLANHGKELRFLAAYAAMLMDRNEMQEAGLWLNRLEELAPENSTTIMLGAEALVRGRQVDQAIQLLHKFLDRPGKNEADRDARILQVASILKRSPAGPASGVTRRPSQASGGDGDAWCGIT